LPEGSRGRIDVPKIDAYLTKINEMDGSDLHIESGVPVKVRLHGKLINLEDRVMEAERMADIIDDFLNDRQRGIYKKKHDLDLAYEVPGVARFRVNCHQTRTGPGAVFRRIPEEILPVEKLNVPSTVLKYCELKSGLVLVTGPTGSGKSTTLAAMIDYINRTKQKHIVTIEEPIEFVHKNKKCYITQREVGVDTDSFAAALRAATREDPDVILVGELRDLETISLAITAAEMGNLVFATLHTNSAAKTIDRIIDVFPEEQQNQIRIMLSVTLKGVCAQTLMPRSDGKGRTVANEILLGSFGLGNIIREGNIAKIISLIEAGRGEGMQMMDDSIMERYREKAINAQTAYLYAFQKNKFEGLLRTSA
jgi:twitching motility protein PilT